ncbi:MAG: hypothetical protein HQ508_04110 [Candidatus Marinimicrobia bacterium]|nr:hypothetical protein [Candidatus Neomarinimicrobiota bacterium]
MSIVMNPDGFSEAIGWVLASFFIVVGAGLLVQELTRPRADNEEIDGEALKIAKERYAHR